MTTSPELVILGDWNATPHDVGRWSPSWLAAQAGLRIYSAGPGKHGDIDYLMTERAPVGVRRAWGGGSDHDAVRSTLGGLQLLQWNMRVGRPEGVVGAELGAILRTSSPDVVALQEAADYHAAIRHQAGLHGYKVLASRQPGRWHNVLLVSLQHRTAAPRFVQLSPRGWRLVAGGSHAELWATSWLVGGWLRVIDVHLPPSVNWTRGRIHGPVMRVAAYVATMVKLRRWVRNWRRRNS